MKGKRKKNQQGTSGLKEQHRGKSPEFSFHLIYPDLELKSQQPGELINADPKKAPTKACFF